MVKFADTDAAIAAVKDFADKAHGDQRRRYTPGDRYIVHPVRVMEIVRSVNTSLPVLLAALLHDVLEDTQASRNHIMEFLLSVTDSKTAAETIRLVVELTDVYTKNNYPKWNRQKRKQMEADRLEWISEDAQTIKYADIMDNAPETVYADPDFARVFLPEYRAILKRLNKGNIELYNRSRETVENAIDLLKVATIKQARTN